MTKKCFFAFFSFFIVCTALFADEYREKIRPIFENRCIACHSCYTSPCQLNLSSYEGFERGAHRENVYNGTRIDSITPTRLGIDARDAYSWRKMGFISVNTSTDNEKNLFTQMLRTSPIELRDLPANSVEESMTCPRDVESLKNIFSRTEDIKMPYGLLPLKDQEINTLKTWIKKGAPGPEQKLSIPKSVELEVREWEMFLNKPTLKEKLVSRYLYEHLFLAHIYFEKEPRQFFRMVRSKTECDLGIDEIATRRPNDYPGINQFYYCLKPLDEIIVAKNHMPFLFSKAILDSTKKIFYSKKWHVSFKKLEDSYSNKIAENPFLAFKDIPPAARYQFLLDHAYYMVSTFIKGPVCYGSNALNSIQEQFFVLFLKPESGYLSKNNKVDEKTLELLILPGAWGSDVKLKDSILLTNTIAQKREEYRKKKRDWMKKQFPHGYSYSDLWDGDKKNDNAVLTVFRHDNNAVVTKGLTGDLSKTVFVLDYSLLERLVYNLVVNFDVFGNVGHQLLTRLYMDYIRMEAEENFLLFIPKEQRLAMRQEWYKGLFTEARMKYMFPLLVQDVQTKIHYQNPSEAKAEFIDHVYYETMAPNVRGPVDTLNWKQIKIEKGTTDPVEASLRELASVKPEGRWRFPNFFPESSYLIVKKKKGMDVYTVIRNREHENISWILMESLRLAPDEDTLTFVKGFKAFYPNFFFVVDETKMGSFIEQTKKITNATEYKELEKTYGLSRLSPEFWPMFDSLYQNFLETDPEEAGQLDLSRTFMQ